MSMQFTVNYATLIDSPLNQFEIINLISLNAPILANINISFNNISFYLSLALILILFFNILTSNYNKIMTSQ